ncbi:MAG: hypothetical protein QOI62_899 [Solirubrobacteraceae bacterium]|jgi:hypothetical protein|nr:hypothetical protein [Solirubrobacteraceae bacterium]
MRGKPVIALVSVVAAAWPLAGVAAADHGSDGHGRGRPPVSACPLGNGAGRVQHVVDLQFDNTHFNRDRPDVPSDLEQMPHLLDFLRGQGTLFTNDHTILISHTAGGILASLTGLYPDRNGQTVSNSYDYYRQGGSPAFTSSFKYWTDVVDPTANALPNMITDGQRTTPAPWVPFTRAGCDVGGAGIANVELENNSTAPSGDMTRVFGVGSPEWNEANDPTTKAQAQTDFVGFAIHCAAGGGLCKGDPNAKPDPLPDEPGGYQGFQALYGAKYVNPAITGGNPCVTNTAGEQIADAATHCGFPGFDAMVAKNTLGEVAQMQEGGVPVTFGYISDAHDNHALGRASGPGEADYVAQLKAYDDAFAAFFARLRRDGIDASNTLFVITVDEGDHFAGGQGTPQPDGTLGYTHVACTDLTACPPNQIGEVTTNIKGLLPAGEPAFDLHFDDAPTFYVDGQPDRADPSVRKLERDIVGLSAIDPYADGRPRVPLAEAMADAVEEKALHMVNADPSRTPTFTMFGNPDFFFQASSPCGANPCVSPGFAWNHGDVQDEIATTWMGMVGPGVRRRGIDPREWTDHTNVRPTMLALLGLRDDYLHDGRVLVAALRGDAVPRGLRAHDGAVRRLGAAYEQLNASFGAFALKTLAASTRGIASADDATYERFEQAIADLTSRRDALASQIKTQLDAAAFDAERLDPDQARREADQAQALVDEAAALADSP